jgi:hypothetical protein
MNSLAPMRTIRLEVLMMQKPNKSEHGQAGNARDITPKNWIVRKFEELS